ncbi:vWA domain-containing protein [Rickettsiella endosymbiont of Miltochrista miniata]|uniref:vWA domain-containing protein n=1 Tax=Rickettsiella endosymbiont of Miltochrista miniata TaxID=3066239 RepID=UPI00313CB723
MNSENQTNTTPSITLSISPQKLDYSLAETQIQIFSPVPHDPIAKETDKLLRLETCFRAPSVSVSPTAKIVHHAIVLDVSSSMRRERIEMAKSSIKSLINFIRESDAKALISLISFSSKVTRIFTFQPIAELTEKKLENFLNQVMLSWGTRIDLGVLEVLALDENKETNVQDGLIFLLTDGVNDRKAGPAPSVMRTFLDKRESLPRIIGLGIGEKYDASYVVQLLNKSPWMHIKNSNTASLVDEKDKIVHQLKGEWVSVDLIIRSLNQYICIPIASVDITERFSISLTPDDLMAGGFLDKTAVDAFFNAREVNMGMVRSNSEPLAVNHQIGFCDEILIPYFESAIANFEKQSFTGSLSLSDKNKALALFRMIPWTTERGFEKIRDGRWNVSREHTIDIQDAALHCEPNNDPNYNKLRLRLKEIVEGKKLSKEIGAKLISESSASASHTTFRGNRNTAQEKQLIDPFSLHDFAEIDEEEGSIKKPYLFLVVNDKTGSIQLPPCRYEKSTIRALKENAEKNYAYTKSLLPPGPYDQGVKKSSIVLFEKDSLLTDYLKTGDDYSQLQMDISPVNQAADCQHIFVCSTSTQGFSEETFLRAKKFMLNLVQSSASGINFSLISYNTSSTIIFENKSIEKAEDRELILKNIGNLALCALEENKGSSPSLGLARSLSLWADSINPTGNEENYYPPHTKIYLFMGERENNYDFVDDYDVLKRKYQAYDNSTAEDDPDGSNIEKFNLLLHSGDEVMLPRYRAKELVDYFSNNHTPNDKVPHFTIFTECNRFPFFIQKFLEMYSYSFGAGVVEKQDLSVVAKREEMKGSGSNSSFFGSHVQALEVSEPSAATSHAQCSP